MPREIQCPFCTGEILTKKAGRPFQTISAFLQRSFSIRIPTNILTFLQENLPVSKKSILSGDCKVCEGTGTIEDPSDDTDKYEEAKSIAESFQNEIEENEAKLAPPCGNRYTIIQGCDLLEVGLGMNNAPSYRVDREKSIRNKGLIDPSEINAKEGGPQIPEGARANHVQGLNPLASPGGHYVIKCSNRFSIITGAQGIDITTGGPITISGGVTQITGPEVTIGTQTGKCVIEGETVNLNGKSIEVTPSDGHFFVKGTASCTGNMMVGGHTHSESASIVKLETTGKNEPSKISAPGNTYGGPAFWGGLSPVPEASQAALKSLVGYVNLNTTNPEHAKIVASPRFAQGIQDELANLLYVSRPQELTFTGYILPGQCVVVGPEGTSTNPAPIPIFNFPHIHAMPDQMHVHETRIPDIKCDSDSAEQLRKEQAGVASSAPLHKSSTNAAAIATSLWGAISPVFVGTAKTTQEGIYDK